MGYQALLFCPDDKLARVVSQVFSELDFTIEPVNEPFAAVKKLMSQRYDAIVVDCENEQNASLLFKSARNSSSNQSSLAIALVEGQAGVAKAYRIGANLVLTKPINIEQAKGTLRVARGLLRKNSDAAGASSAGTIPAAAPARPAPVPAESSFQAPSRVATPVAPAPSRSELPKFEMPVAATPATLPAELSALAASVQVEEKTAFVPAPAAQVEATVAHQAAETPKANFSAAVKNDPVKNNDAVAQLFENNAVKNQATSIAFTPVAAQANSALPAATLGSAAAAAPAREGTAPPAKEAKTVEVEPAKPLSNPTSEAPPMFSSGTSDAPSFGGLSEEAAEEPGSNKKILIAAGVVLALATLGYLGYESLGKSTASAPAQPVSAPQNASQPAPVLAPMSAPAPSNGTSQPASSAVQSVTPKTTAGAIPGKPSAGAGNSPMTRIAADSEPATTKSVPSPMVVKSGARSAGTSSADESAPLLSSSVAAASTNDSGLSSLMQSSSSVAKPSLATMRVSQGVSQGLVIKRVQPKYPQAALAVHTQGAVQIEATVTKDGSVTNVKVLSGDPVLARAAVEAVRQWRYKPYYLDGQPVDIETQITVNFKAN